MPIQPKQQPPYYNLVNQTSIPRKTYKALITQSSTSNPTIIVLENSIGNIIWERDGAPGQYKGTLTGAFTENKTWVIITQGGGYNDTLNTYTDVYAFLGTGNENNIWVYSEYNGVLTDGQMSNCPIEINVYE